MGLVTSSSTNYDLAVQDRVIGYYIYDLMDKDVTDIRDLLVNENTHKPRYAVIEIGGLMSIKGKVVLIPWTALKRGGMSRMDIACPEEQIMSAPTPLNPLVPKRSEEVLIHSYFNVDPYWLTEKEEEESEEKDETGSDQKPPEKPVDDTPISGLAIESDEQV